MTPWEVAAELRRLSARVASTGSFSHFSAEAVALARKVSAQQSHADPEDLEVLVFYSHPTAASRTTEDDDGTVRGEIDMTLLHAGAQDLEWDEDAIFVVVPESRRASVLQAFESLRGGEHGERVKAFLSTFQHEGNVPKRLASIVRVAARVSGRKKRKPAKRVEKAPPRRAKPKPPPIPDDVTMPVTEYSCQMEFALTADFEGSVDRTTLVAKLKREIVASIEAGVKSTARAFGLEPTAVKVRPLRLDCAVSDDASVEDNSR